MNNNKYQPAKTYPYITSLPVYTGSGARPNCTSNCPFCTQSHRFYDKQSYQGTLADIEQIIQAFPDLKEAYILGNPDPSVDTDFCNKAAKRFIEAGCKVMFSASGFGGKQTMEKLLHDLPASKVEYVSFSVDSLDPDTTHFLKGIRLSLDEVEEGISYCLERGITVKIQPTLWDVNQNEAENIVTYFFKKYGIRWFTFHFGSLEAYRGKENHHVAAKDVREINEKLRNFAAIHGLNIRVPMIMLNDEEFEHYKNTFINHCANSNPSKLQLWITSEGIKVACCSVLPTAHPELALFNIEEDSKFAPCSSSTCCPAQKATLGPGYDTEGLHPVCVSYRF